MKKLELTNLPEQPYDVVEAVNQLRVNVSFCGSNVKVIMLTSSLPNEGKSFLTVQLWKAMAEVGLTTLLVDCDLRKSELHSRFTSPDKEKVLGMAHYLSYNATINDVMYETNVPGGYVIPAAKTVTNPTMLLESGLLTRMLDELTGVFDYILIDTPPVGSVADALSIAAHCDGTILIAQSESTSRKLVHNSLQMLRRTGTPLLGIVLNRVNLNSKSKGYYYYRKYYRSGYYYAGQYGQYGKGKNTQSNKPAEKKEEKHENK